MFYIMVIFSLNLNDVNITIIGSYMLSINLLAGGITLFFR